MFVTEDAEMILLNGFIKKQQKTPKTDIDLEQNRLSDIASE